MAYKQQPDNGGMVLTFHQLQKHWIRFTAPKKILISASFLGLGTLLVLAANAEKLASQVTEQVAVASETFEMAYVSTLSNEYHGQLQNEAGASDFHIRVLEAKNQAQASVLINDQEVMKFRSEFNGLSPALRAKRSANRLYAFLSVQGDARLIKPEAQENEVVIRVGDEVLARIDEQTAKKSKNDMKHLALIWTNLTRKALGVHPIMRGAMPNSRSKLNRDNYIDPATFKATGHALKGIASWYGPGFHGRRAADGSRYSMYELTAAHKSLPFGTIVRVRNEKNGRTVVVRITDRGPYIKGRVIDLSKAAANAIGMPGITPVTVEIMERNPHFKIPEPVLNPPSLREMALEQNKPAEVISEKSVDNQSVSEPMAPEEIQAEEIPTTEAKAGELASEEFPDMKELETMVNMAIAPTQPAVSDTEVMADEAINAQAVVEEKQTIDTPVSAELASD